MSTDRAAETAEGQRTRPGRKQGATGEFTTFWNVEHWTRCGWCPGPFHRHARPTPD
jgi:hypothetical protein